VLSVERSGRTWLWEPGTTAPIEADFKTLFGLRYGVPLPDLVGAEQPAEVPQLSEDGSTIVAAVSSDKLGVWDVATGKQRALLTNENYGDIRGWPCPDGHRVVTVNPAPRVMAGDEAAHVWDVASGRVIKTLDGQDGPLFAAACSPDGTTIVIVSAGGTARLYNAITLEFIRDIRVDGGGRILDVSFSNDGSHFVTAHRDAVARIWDTRTGELKRRLLGHAGGVLRAVFSPDDRLVMTVGDDHTRIWDATAGKQIGEYLGDGEGTAFIAHDCSKLALGNYDDEKFRIHTFGACGANDVLLSKALKYLGNMIARDESR
jgi:WD40 repeat protein